MTFSLQSFASLTALVDALSTRITSQLSARLAQSDTASIALSGGTTPRPLYERLAQTELPWARIQATLVDERWVDANSPASNENLVRQSLLAGCAAQTQFISLKTNDATPEAGLKELNTRIATLKAPFDVVVLGLGADGHTASWFPHAQGLDAALDANSDRLVEAVTAQAGGVAGAHLERATLTLAALQRAGLIALMMVGEEKKAAWEAALQDGPVEDMPVRALLRCDNAHVEAYWAGAPE